MKKQLSAANQQTIAYDYAHALWEFNRQVNAVTAAQKRIEHAYGQLWQHCTPSQRKALEGIEPGLHMNVSSLELLQKKVNDIATNERFLANQNTRTESQTQRAYNGASRGEKRNHTQTNGSQQVKSNAPKPALRPGQGMAHEIDKAAHREAMRRDHLRSQDQGRER